MKYVITIMNKDNTTEEFYTDLCFAEDVYEIAERIAKGRVYNIERTRYWKNKNKVELWYLK